MLKLLCNLLFVSDYSQFKKRKTTIIKMLIVVLFKMYLSQAYFCPWSSLGFDGINEMVIDKYSEEGNNFIRIGELEWKTRDSFCFENNEEGCSETRNVCSWSEGICIPNIFSEPSCELLCERVLNGEGPSCFGECSNIDDFYNTCNSTPSPSSTRSTTSTVFSNSCHTPEPTKTGFCMEL